MPLAGKQLLPRELAALARAHGWRDAENWPAIIAVCLAESAGYERAYHDNDNGTRDVGLMQINIAHSQIGTEAEAGLYDPDNNFAAARKLYDARGFQPWVAYNSGAYEKFLPKAILGVANHLAIKFGFGKTQTYGFYK